MPAMLRNASRPSNYFLIFAMNGSGYSLKIMAVMGGGEIV